MNEQRAAFRNATSREVACRLALHAALVAMRDEIEATNPEDLEPRRAFGQGKLLSKHSTPNLRSAATRVQQSYEKDEAHRAAARAGGIGAPRIAGIIALRRDLTDANSAQKKAFKSRAAINAKKKRLLSGLTKDATRIRKAAAIVFRGQPEMLLLFKTTIPRRARNPKKKTPPSGGATPPGSTPAPV